MQNASNPKPYYHYCFYILLYFPADVTPFNLICKWNFNKVISNLVNVYSWRLSILGALWHVTSWRCRPCKFRFWILFARFDISPFTNGTMVTLNACSIWHYCVMLHANFIYVAASKYSRKHVICEKYKTAQSFKLYFLQNSALVQLCTTASDCTGVGNIPGNHFVKAFSALPSHS
jgi:hypothetical protein